MVASDRFVGIEAVSELHEAGCIVTANWQTYWCVSQGTRPIILENHVVLFHGTIRALEIFDRVFEPNNIDVGKEQIVT